MLDVDQIFNAEGQHEHVLSIMLYNFVKNIVLINFGWFLLCTMCCDM